ncbi:Holliday junction resolvase RuvX [bacterium SCSIO 12741]|nr:Holliday junction resolvase RuvX [bacterium SCSIO 12741]
MGRIVAIDYGTKRVGIAATDPLKIIASGLTTVPAEQAVKFLTDYARQEEVEALVIGLPLRLNDELSEVEKDIQKFIQRLKKELPELPIHRQDERYTSKMAMETMVAGGVKKKNRRKKELLDQVSATLILQAYLEANNGL